ncbi:Spx/MgsR family RNA polymerase-binding regulatory protein [Kangiella sp. HZ709]|uniref:Spx/MgsR family RNA polymerase-binding regulatory protein n=1 Tax=Kangiella sp. HZ709 TaxID=2666328 RepID=UPI0012AF245D|nr:Spx/MgsR family RNA polymerase-binding regulatory protein [Kangiella sp. HZ709]MRX28345.1 Spx/MgsR family RNA polymerase-binding regulatory protein [Kangiella sp. HZ709]
MIKIYGIPNCDTVRKAVKWLEAQDIKHEFIDYRKNPLAKAEIESWDKAIGWEAFLNKRSTAWKPLEQSVKDTIDRETALSLMLDKVTLIKRPVLVKGKEVFLGFKPEQYQEIFA